MRRCLFLFALLCSACGNAEDGATPRLPTAQVAIQPTSVPVVIVATPPQAVRVAPTVSTVRAIELATVLPEIVPTVAPPPTLTPPTLVPLPPTLPLPAPTDDAGREALLAQVINRVRAEHNLPPYSVNAELSVVARAHSCDLAANHMISHTSSDGRTLKERMPAAEPPWVWPSESIAAGSDDPEVIVAMWMDEPPEGWHRRNILDVDQREIGVGYCATADDPTGNMHYWTVDFTRRG